MTSSQQFTSQVSAPNSLIDTTSTPRVTSVSAPVKPATPATTQASPGTAPKTEEEPVLAIHNIQGNILGGFNKDNQTLIFFEIEFPFAFKAWLKTQIQFISTASEVIAFNRLFKSMKKRRGYEGTIKATWLNIAFSFEGLKKLTDVADTFTDNSFKAGLAARATDLNDPVDKDGKPLNWVVGGADDKIDVIFIVASDDPSDMRAEVSRILGSVEGAKLKFIEEGVSLPNGSEHFGNKDGVSQPGVRGRLSDAEDDFLTLRQNPDNRGQGKPGQDVLWPGEFVFGYEGQNPDADNLENSKGEIASAGPNWAKDGSYLVFRRLRQDVQKFHQFLKDTAEHLDTNPDKVSAKLIGRWASGAPTVRTPDEDNPAMGANDCANNNFEFNDGGPSTPDTPNAKDCNDPFPADQFPRNDAFSPSTEATGIRCPFAAHTRKAYPRNDKTPGGGGPGPLEIDRSEVTTQTHRMLRRGIPYGAASDSTPDNPQADECFVDRGLHFLSYQTSIEDQFEFVTQNWVNNPNFSNTAAAGHSCPGQEPFVGHDPIIGQSSGADGDRTRQFTIRLTDDHNQTQCQKLNAPEEWVFPTGGGYFFAPSISALEDVLVIDD